MIRLTLLTPTRYVGGRIASFDAAVRRQRAPQRLG